MLRIFDVGLARRLRVARQYNAGATTMGRVLREFLADESGAMAIEYGLIAAGISLAIVSVATGVFGERGTSAILVARKVTQTRPDRSPILTAVSGEFARSISGHVLIHALVACRTARNHLYRSTNFTSTP